MGWILYLTGGGYFCVDTHFGIRRMDGVLLMYNETKLAVEKAFDVAKRLFFMGYDNYMKLLEAVSKQYPTEKEVADYMEDGLSADDAKIAILKHKYTRAAVEAGFTEDQGLAMLEYASMLKDIRDE